MIRSCGSSSRNLDCLDRAAISSRHIRFISLLRRSPFRVVGTGAGICQFGSFQQSKSQPCIRELLFFMASVHNHCQFLVELFDGRDGHPDFFSELNRVHFENCRTEQFLPPVVDWRAACP